MNADNWNLVIGAAVVAAIVYLCWKGYRRSDEAWTYSLEATQRSAKAVEIAEIKETVSYSVGAVLCMLILIVHNIWIFITYNTASTVMQQIAAACLWTGGNILWGLGVAQGRTKRYTVYQVETSPPPAEPRM
jgi:hypothetical protein